MLERIYHEEVNILLGSGKSDGNVKIDPSKEQVRNVAFREQLQQITNTIIEPVITSNGSGNIAKVSICKPPFQAESVLLSGIR